MLSVTIKQSADISLSDFFNQTHKSSVSWIITFVDDTIFVKYEPLKEELLPLIRKK